MKVLAKIPGHRNIILVKRKSKSHERKDKIVVRLDGKSRNVKANNKYDIK